MNSIQIEHALERLIKPSFANFLGVFSHDLIPPLHSITSFPARFVANTDDSNAPGEHWLAFYYENANHLEFVDSFAFPSDLYNINLTPTISNTRRIQSYTSTVCGQYCIYFLYQRSLALSFYHIILSFHSFDFNWNDHQVAHFVKNHFSFSNAVLNNRSLLSICKICQTCKCASHSIFCTMPFH